MFTIDTNITDLKVKERNLFKVFFSMNVHQVATPEMSAEDAKSYVFFFREGGKYLSYIGLYFLHSDRRLYYSHSSNPFLEAQYAEVESEARSFAEDLGAVLDELDLTKMSDTEKDLWLDEQDIFSTKKKEDELPAAESADQPRSVEPSSVVPSAQAVQSVPAPAAAVSETAQSMSAERAAAETAAAPVVHSAPEPVPPEQQPPVTAPPVLTRPKISQPAPPRQPADGPKVASLVGNAAPERPPMMKTSKQPLSGGVRGSGVVSREREALARLLASF